MATLEELIEELVTANRILARENVVDSFGHISVRHPGNPQRYLLSRSRAPDCIERDDLMEFGLDGEPVDDRPDSLPLRPDARAGLAHVATRHLYVTTSSAGGW